MSRVFTPRDQCPHCGSQMRRSKYSEAYGEAEDTPWRRESMPSSGQYESMANERFPVSGETPFLLRSGGEAASESESWKTAAQGETWSESEGIERAEDYDGRMIASEARLQEVQEAQFSTEHGKLTADEIAALLGRKSALVALHWLLASNELQQEALAALLMKPGPRSVRIVNADLTIPDYLRLLSRLCGDAAEQTEQEAAESPFQFGARAVEESEAFSKEAFSQSEMRTAQVDETDASEVRLEDEEFRVDRLPQKARVEFSKTESAAWRQAIEEAIGAGIRDPNDLADLIFFMQHRDRVASGAGKSIDKVEPDFFKLRAEWNLYRTIASRRLNPSAECSVFLPAQPSSNYEQYLAEATTGRITLMINGRTSGRNKTEAFDSMQRTVESLGRGDTVYLAAFQVNPTKLTVPGSAGDTTWADLFVRKATQGVKIRIILTDFPEHFQDWKSDLTRLNEAIKGVPDAARDNLKYIVSMHPAQLRFKLVSLTPRIVRVVPNGILTVLNHVGTHHQKFMVTKKSGATIAYCGGLDISPARTPEGWPDNKLQPTGRIVWHDTHVMLEGLIARDLEREFVLRWNREKEGSTGPRPVDKSTGPQPGRIEIDHWEPFETLVQAPLGGSDREAARNTQTLQMLRTVSVGATTPDFRRDDVWQGYFRLIGCATHFLFMENQYFHEPAMADAIVKQAEAQPDLIVIIVVAFAIDDPDNQFTDRGVAQQNEFFKRLFKIPESRRRVYTMVGRLVHAKLIMADDRALCVGSTNADPRDFFMDTQLNVMLDNPQAVKNFRHQLWSHDLGVGEVDVAGLPVSGFIAQWDKVANANELLNATPEKMKGEGVIPFDPTTVKGKWSDLPDVLTEVDGG
jgi:phosphatidylserine/phosphatidylglycerophosphate/cardiolipin synthase-like enzyme